MDIDYIKEQVSISQVLSYYKIDFYNYGEREQIHCPFHLDKKKSARVFYSTNTLFCWTCNKVWDVVEFVKDMEEIDFYKACGFLCRVFGIQNITSDYMKKFNKYRKKLPSSLNDYSRSMERIFKLHLRNLTCVQFYDNIYGINQCWYYKDFLDYNITNGITLVHYYKWLEISLNYIKEWVLNDCKCKETR